jgi:hypothetical protein
MTPAASSWPTLPVAEWEKTRDTLQLWTQIAGKVRMMNTPLVNHWWNVTLYVTGRGLTTSLIPHETGPSFQVDFDFLRHELEIATVTGESRTIPLAAGPVADFYSWFMSDLAALDVPTAIWPMPVEIEGAIRFDTDRIHTEYVPAQAERFWRLLVATEKVFEEFRTRFVGKVSPVHLFWGALDFAVTRFSGRTAPPYTGRAPNCGPHVMLEAYSHEVSSAGYWPGGGIEGAFYSYAYPEPDGYRDAPVLPDGAYFDQTLGEFLLPYEAVRTAPDPRQHLLAFLQSTYEAAADCGKWDRQALERP